MIKVITTVKELKEALKSCREQGKTIGLVPTMGALHEGHASLVRRSVAENDITVVSDFVNPTQFNDKNDLNNYPRTMEADCRLLENVGAQYVFAPSVEEMYPEPDTRTFDFTPLDKVMEGPNRPGHFNGVAQIVSKLFYAVEPDRAYFGEKDFQQLQLDLYNASLNEEARVAAENQRRQDYAYMMDMLEERINNFDKIVNKQDAYYDNRVLVLTRTDVSYIPRTIYI